MSNRYVWARYSTRNSHYDGEYQSSITQRYWDRGSNSSPVLFISNSRPQATYGSDGDGSYVINQDDADEIYNLTVGQKQSIPGSVYFNVHANKNGHSSPDTFYSASSGAAVEMTEFSTNSGGEYIVNNARLTYPYKSKGTANGTISNSASSTYPPNDTQPRIASICVIPALLRRCKYVE